MKVTVLTATQSPMDVIGIAADMCYGKPEPSAKRVRRCAENGHMSVFEHASATFIVEGISRACQHAAHAASNRVLLGHVAALLRGRWK